MLIFACSDQAGAGRSVTCANVAYRRALLGDDVCYLDCYLDFRADSLVAGALFQLEESIGRRRPGLSDYLAGEVAWPTRLDVWSDSEREELRHPPRGAGRLVVLPAGGYGAGFSPSPERVQRFSELLLGLDEEFHVTVVDLDGGRSPAMDLALIATAGSPLDSVVARWLVFHRWTRKQVIAAADLVHGERGLLSTAEARGHDRQRFLRSLRLVRTAVVDPGSPELAGLRPAQIAWLHEVNGDLQRLASRSGIGRVYLLGAVPHDPVLQWREQLITDDEVALTAVANQGTVDAFEELARKLGDNEVWEGL